MEVIVLLWSKDAVTTVSSLTPSVDQSCAQRRGLALAYLKCRLIDKRRTVCANALLSTGHVAKLNPSVQGVLKTAALVNRPLCEAPDSPGLPSPFCVT